MPVEITVENFNPFEIMDSGQCFRMVALGPDTVETIAFGNRVAVTRLNGNRFAFDCTPDAFNRLWRAYFDLDTDYRIILNAAPKEDAFLARAVARSQGLRILRQEPWETLCGFILSQRKNLPAIRACVEALCCRYGKPVPGTSRKAFPTPERLAALDESEMRLCSLGYRAPYLLDAARRVASGALNLQALSCLPDESLLNKLLCVRGVGVKVADCVMLFAYHRLARAPVDVWIQRVIAGEYGGVSPFAGYGAYAGVYQQMLFVLKRDENRASASCPPECSKNTKPRRSPTPNHPQKKGGAQSL